MSFEGNLSLKKPGLSLGPPNGKNPVFILIICWARALRVQLADRKNYSIFDDGEGKIKAFLTIRKYVLTEKLSPALPCQGGTLGGFQAIVL